MYSGQYVTNCEICSVLKFPDVLLIGEINQHNYKTTTLLNVKEVFTSVKSIKKPVKVTNSLNGQHGLSFSIIV